MLNAVLLTNATMDRSGFVPPLVKLTEILRWECKVPEYHEVIEP
jgi:hypothetical protein